MMALSLHYLGDQAGTCACALRTINAPIAPDRHLQTIHYGSDQRVGAFVILAQALWLQGFADRAIRAAQAGIDEAINADHANSVCLALADGASLIAEILAGNRADAERYGAMLSEHAEKHSLGVWRIYGLAVQGRIYIECGAASDGVTRLSSALTDLRETPLDIRFQLYLVWLAEALGKAGQAVAGLSAIDEALERAERTEERWYLPALAAPRGTVASGGDPGRVRSRKRVFRAIAPVGEKAERRCPGNCVVPQARLDCGATRAVAKRRVSTWRRCPISSLRALRRAISRRPGRCWTI